MSKIKHDVLATLMNIKTYGPKDKFMGLCDNVCQLLVDDDVYMDEQIYDVLTAIFEQWPERSVSSAYPVGNWTQQPFKLFWRFTDDQRSMWDEKTRYGAARLALLDFSIDTLTKELGL